MDCIHMHPEVILQIIEIKGKRKTKFLCQVHCNNQCIWIHCAVWEPKCGRKVWRQNKKSKWSSRDVSLFASKGKGVGLKYHSLGTFLEGPSSFYFHVWKVSTKYVKKCFRGSESSLWCQKTVVLCFDMHNLENIFNAQHASIGRMKKMCLPQNLVRTVLVCSLTLSLVS